MRGRPVSAGRARVVAVLATALLASLGPVRPAAAHLPPAVYLVLGVADEAVKVRLVVNFPIFQDWFGVDPETLPQDGQVTDEVAERIRGVMAGATRVRVDRVEVEGSLQRVTPDVYTDHEVEWKYVNVTMVYGAKGRPKQVSFAWTRYDTDVGWLFEALDAELEAYGKTTYPVFRRAEPEIVWHAPLEVPPPPTFVLPKPVPPPHIDLPVASVAIAVLGFAVFALAGRRGASRGERRVVLSSAVALALALSGVARTEVRLPGGGGYERPSDTEALYTFEALLRNVYRAFDYDSESQIYDTLSRSVSGDLLERIYLEVHQSLVLQDQGGAVCKIQSVDLLSKAVLPPAEPDAPYYRVRARWRVEGKVGHWGHTHQRVNEYAADFTIALEPDGWKIAALDVRSQTRVDDGRPGSTQPAGG